MEFTLTAAALAAMPLLGATRIVAAPAPNWVASWTTSMHGPYPLGNPTAQPDMRFALPSAETGATDQSFRLIVRPDVWGRQARIRLSNVFGTRPVTFNGVHIGLQSSGSALVPGTNRTITFDSGHPSSSKW